jgi:hypothetical protein
VHLGAGGKPKPVVSSIEFCNLIRGSWLGRLVLKVVNNGLICEDLAEPQLLEDFLLEEPSILLAAILNKRKLRGERQVKLLLSYLLAKAVWQYYKSDWMTPYWTKYTIQFMRERLDNDAEPRDIFTQIHKPYLATKLRPSFRPPAHPPEEPELGLSLATHSYPKILGLGILLLEIKLGEDIERHRPQDSVERGSPMDNEDHHVAGQIILKPA